MAHEKEGEGIQFEYSAEGVRLTVMSGGYRFYGEEKAFPMPDSFHAHAWYEMFIARSDAMRIIFEDEICVIKKGEIIIVKPGVIHYAGGGDYDAANFSVAHGSSPCGKRLKRLLDLKKYKTVRADRTAAELFDFYLSSSGRGSSELAASLLFSLLLRLSELSRDTECETNSDNDMSRVYKIEQYLYNHFTSDSDLSLLAESMHISKRQLARVFKKQYGVSYGEKVRELRMGAAARQLAIGKSVADTASIVGYCSVGAFSSAFERAFGQSPASYQKSKHNQKGESNG